MPGDNAPTSATSLRMLGVAGIVAGVIGVAWNLLSIAGVSGAYYEYRDRAQDRAAVVQADREEQARRAIRGQRETTTPPATQPVTLMMVPVPPVPGTVMAGVTLCVIVFILNTALAFVLLASSGILPRRPGRAGPLLRMYATLKPPAAVLAGVAWWWLLRLAFDETAAWHVACAVVVIVIGCAYPALLNALLRRPGLMEASTRPAG